MSTIRKIYIAETREVDAEAGIYETWISTESVDRDGDVVVATGGDVSNFLKNPVVLFGHNYWEANAIVGKSLELEIIPGKGIRSRFQFAGADVSEDADLVRRLWAGGFLNATSIGFIPRKTSPRETDDGEPLQRGVRFEEWELLEFSIVPVPANQDALRLAAKAAGLLGSAPAPESVYNNSEVPASVSGDTPAGFTSNSAANPPAPNNDTPTNDASAEPEVPAEILDDLGRALELLSGILIGEKTE